MMWIAMTISNVGTWMTEIGTTWLMASMPTSDFYIALIQTAITLPFLFLAYPSGTLADLIDHRRMLLALHIALFLTASGLAISTYFDAVTPLSLLLFTFALGAGNAMMRPAWAASVPDFAPRAQLPNAITLNTLSTNVTRAIGPAIGGFIIFQSGPTGVFIFNAVSFTGLIVALAIWKPKKPDNQSALPVERFMGAFKAGLRYTRNVRSLRIVLFRSAMFFFFASVSWALLPIIVIREMNMGAQSFGISMTVVGLGTILGAFLLPRFHRLLTRNQIISLSTVILSLPLVLLAYKPNLYTLGLTLVALGCAWISSFSSFILSAQMVVPNWVRARTISLVMLTFGGSMGFGSLVWGSLSDHYGSSISIFIASTGLLLTLLLSRRFAIANDSLDPSPTTQWPIAIDEDSVPGDRGPVLVSIQYCIPQDKTDEFLSLMKKLRVIRKRNGAYFWQIFHDANDHQLFSEVYMSESWFEVLRQRDRMTYSEMSIRDQVMAMHVGEKAPATSIQIAGKA
ncbi:MFS transporter [Cycloclasticus sp. PY97N]|nr:MFS transporter [Cycloclasticus sp. PY97N]